MQGKTCVGKDKGGGRRRWAGILTIHNSYRPRSFSRHRRQQVPSRKSSPMTDDAVASWHRFIMILLLITICQFSLAQPVCHFSLSPVELPVPLSGARGPPFSEPLCHGHCHLLGFPGRPKPAQSLQLCG